MEEPTSRVPNFASKAALDNIFSGTPTRSSETPSTEDYRVRIPNFEGPLDLLLHLIQKEQLNIYDIPIAQICKSYLEYLEWMFQPDVNLAGEFFVMAATLTYIKSQILLPTDGDGEELDPRLPLVAQLLEYERFKKAAMQIDQKPWLLRDVFPRPQTAAQDLMPEEALLTGPIEAVETFQLLLSLKVATDRTTKKPIQFTPDTVSLREKVTAVGQYLEATKILDFTAILPEARKKLDIVISFLAILELARLKFIEIIQHENFGPIQIRSVRSLQELNMSMLDQF